MKKTVEQSNWIRIGEKYAVVCHVYNSEKTHIEVVYLDEANRAINEDAYLRNNEWNFVRYFPCGGYADKYPRLYEFVAKLRRGR